MCWKKSAKDKPEIPISSIKREIETVANIDSMEIGGFNFVSFIVEGVKLSFYAAPRKRIPSMQVIPFKNNLQLADIKSIGAMKMEAMLRRSKFRDYYDIYTVLHEGVDIQEMIEMALEHSGHLLKRKNLLAMLCDGGIFLQCCAMESGLGKTKCLYNFILFMMSHLTIFRSTSSRNSWK